MLFAGWEVRMVKKLWPRACGLGQHFQAQGHSFFTIRTDLSRQITCLFFVCSKLALQITNGFVYAARLVRRLPTICKQSRQRTSNSDSRQKKDVLKNILFSNYFMLAVFISLIIKFSKIGFAVWNFMRSLKFYYTTKTISVRRCMLLKSIE